MTAAAPSAPVARGRGRHRQSGDRVYRSSFFLLVSTVVTAALSFVFWVVVARFYTAAQVGLATSLISATSLLATFSLLGLNNTLIRFPAERQARNAQISQALLLVAGVGCAAGGLYLLGLPWYGAKLAFVRDDWTSAVAFTAFCGCAAASMLVKSIFNAARIPEYNVLIDGLTQGAAKVAVPAVLTGLGVFGIVASAGVGYVVTLGVALLVLWRRLGFRADLRTRGTRLREKFRFSAASHASNLINLAPVLATPLIVLHHLGAAEAGYFFVAFQIAAMLNAVSTAVGEAVFAEVSHQQSKFRELMLRSARIIAVVQVPAAAAVAFGGGLLLHVFGAGYAEHARPLLTVLAVAALPVALNTWACFALKLAQRMGHLITANTVMAVLSIGLSAAFADRGLVWVGYAWAAGNAVAGVYSTAALILGRPSRPKTVTTPIAGDDATPVVAGASPVVAGASPAGAGASPAGAGASPAGAGASPAAAGPSPVAAALGPVAAVAGPVVPGAAPDAFARPRDVAAPQARGAWPREEAGPPVRGAWPREEAGPQAAGAWPREEAEPPARGARPREEADPPAGGAWPREEAGPPARDARPPEEADPQARGAWPWEEAEPQEHGAWPDRPGEAASRTPASRTPAPRTPAPGAPAPYAATHPAGPSRPSTSPERPAP
ncbi:oligosaccharide flippase family protein [Streptomyces sp. NPDC046985]|uniref:oligosaccharide flippase family protein n=1 Tax=Streptomyces sp. NPDC046985 TaxID=3155377 RepID=UPI0033E37C2B